MPLQSPNLDDRRFEDLVDEARRRITQTCPEWSDLHASDPGMTLLELFAYLTDIMHYRLNRVPEKIHIELLHLIGVVLQPPDAASVTLQFTLTRPQQHKLEIPRGTRVASSRSDASAEAPVFTTMEAISIAPGSTQVEVLARHCELIEGELVGYGTGMPGLTVTVSRPPIISPTGDELDLVVGVETSPDELEGSEAAIRYDDKVFRIWREEDNFALLEENRFVYIADRLAGTITFAPAIQMERAEGGLTDTPLALAEVPQDNREIRIWYCRGGGRAGNVMANLLTVLKDAIPGLEVNNAQSATGGGDAETIENAVKRGPVDLHSLHRAVTARDFELIAKRSSGAVDRAHAYTKASLWEYAPPGTVELLLVPHIPEEQLSHTWVTAEMLQSHQTDVAREQIQAALDKRKPLGTSCVVNWARIKTVKIKANVIVREEEDKGAVKQRILQRLWQTITPVSWQDDEGWPFGLALSAYDIYKIIGAEPGVVTLSQVRMLISEAPDKEVESVCADAFQPDTWYAVSGDTVFRTTNNASGWESVAHFQDEKAILVKSFPKEASPQRRPGLLAVATELSNDDADGGSALHISHDAGETWEVALRTTFKVYDMAWLDRDNVPILLLATEKGLYELPLNEGAEPNQVVVNSKKPTLGFYAVAVSADIFGGTSVAVSTQKEQGVYLSNLGGKSDSFEFLGLKEEMVRVLAFHHYGPHRYLCAGIAVIGNDPGKGFFRWRLTGAEENPEGWRAYDKNWDAGGCRSLAFQGSKVFAASLRGGVLKLDIADSKPSWIASDISCNLPLYGAERLFHPVDTIAADPNGNILLAGGIEGVYRSTDEGANYENVSNKEFLEKVSVPETWLFCSDEHAIEVFYQDEIPAD